MKNSNRPQSEVQLHIEVAGYLDLWLAPLVWFSTFPAGGGGFHRGQLLKQMHLKPGVPDILLLWGRLFGIELKTPEAMASANMGLSADQIKCHCDLNAAGAWTTVCSSLDQVKMTLKQWEIPVLDQKRTETSNSLSQAVQRAVSKVNSVVENYEWPRDDYFENLLAKDRMKR